MQDVQRGAQFRGAHDARTLLVLWACARDNVRSSVRCSLHRQEHQCRCLSSHAEHRVLGAGGGVLRKDVDEHVRRREEVCKEARLRRRAAADAREACHARRQPSSVHGLLSAEQGESERFLRRMPYRAGVAEQGGHGDVDDGEPPAHERHHCDARPPPARRRRRGRCNFGDARVSLRSDVRGG